MLCIVAFPSGAPGMDRAKWRMSSSVLHDSKRRQTCESPTWTQMSELPARPSAGSSGTRASDAARRLDTSDSYAPCDMLSACSSSRASLARWYVPVSRCCSSALLPIHSSAGSRLWRSRCPWTGSKPTAYMKSIPPGALATRSWKALLLMFTLRYFSSCGWSSTLLSEVMSVSTARGRPTRRAAHACTRCSAEPAAALPSTRGPAGAAAAVEVLAAAAEVGARVPTLRCA
mmetsp:Transcript_53931/g.117648  ORF Transcript_53931/g.117648 Transcript_53931/m.117648 type:complete len:230 (-) Transcript_53931:563-1252(-)